ncbi:hypothetical protein [Paludibacterium denitrificans]|uniref:Uncharacterized protein n=1 Tax=Paludibacterium denitrificans TaxID=2675226 RepID=A0A844GA47_9NEIS|nr:hypothetical protein [Paludibacterium denitrificans]MTD33316.1 hypothetical protein [Paludibacterium denitrificans]
MHVNLVISLLMAELVVRAIRKQRCMPVNSMWLLGMLLVAVSSLFSLATRNASIGFLSMTMSITLMVLLVKFRTTAWWKILVYALAGMSLVSVLGWLSGYLILAGKACARQLP